MKVKNQFNIPFIGLKLILLLYLFSTIGSYSYQRNQRNSEPSFFDSIKNIAKNAGNVVSDTLNRASEENLGEFVKSVRDTAAKGWEKAKDLEGMKKMAKNMTEDFDLKGKVKHLESTWSFIKEKVDSYAQSDFIKRSSKQYDERHPDAAQREKEWKETDWKKRVDPEGEMRSKRETARRQERERDEEKAREKRAEERRARARERERERESREWGRKVEEKMEKEEVKEEGRTAQIIHYISSKVTYIKESVTKQLIALSETKVGQIAIRVYKEVVVLLKRLWEGIRQKLGKKAIVAFTFFRIFVKSFSQVARDGGENLFDAFKFWLVRKEVSKYAIKIYKKVSLLFDRSFLLLSLPYYVVKYFLMIALSVYGVWRLSHNSVANLLQWFDMSRLFFMVSVSLYILMGCLCVFDAFEILMDVRGVAKGRRPRWKFFFLSQQILVSVVFFLLPYLTPLRLFFSYITALREYYLSFAMMAIRFLHSKGAVVRKPEAQVIPGEKEQTWRAKEVSKSNDRGEENETLSRRREGRKRDKENRGEKKVSKSDDTTLNGTESENSGDTGPSSAERKHDVLRRPSRERSCERNARSNRQRREKSCGKKSSFYSCDEDNSGGEEEPLSPINETVLIPSNQNAVLEAIQREVLNDKWVSGGEIDVLSRLRELQKGREGEGRRGEENAEDEKTRTDNPSRRDYNRLVETLRKEREEREEVRREEVVRQMKKAVPLASFSQYLLSDPLWWRMIRKTKQFWRENFLLAYCLALGLYFFSFLFVDSSLLDNAIFHSSCYIVVFMCFSVFYPFLITLPSLLYYGFSYACHHISTGSSHPEEQSFFTSSSALIPSSVPYST